MWSMTKWYVICDEGQCGVFWCAWLSALWSTMSSVKCHSVNWDTRPFFSKCYSLKIFSTVCSHILYVWQRLVISQIGIIMINYTCERYKLYLTRVHFHIHFAKQKGGWDPYANWTNHDVTCVCHGNVFLPLSANDISPILLICKIFKLYFTPIYSTENAKSAETKCMTY